MKLTADVVCICVSNSFSSDTTPLEPGGSVWLNDLSPHHVPRKLLRLEIAETGFEMDDFCYCFLLRLRET